MCRMPGLVVAALLPMLLLAFGPAPALAGVTTRVSVASDGTEGNGYSGTPSISADGRFVAFQSCASNLVSGDTNGCCDVFVHDMLTGETTRVSLSSTGEQGNDDCPWWPSPAISADGRYVAFVSLASNLVDSDTNAEWDVFVRDRQAGQTTRVSVASDGSQGNHASSDPRISGDGRNVAFVTWATNFVPYDPDNGADVFIHDCETRQTTTPLYS